MTDDDRPDTTQPMSPRAWLNTFTPAKAHAIYYGFGFAALAAIGNSPTVLLVFLGLGLWASGTTPRNVWKEDDLDDEQKAYIKKVSTDNRAKGLHAQIKAEIRHKPHYYWGGGIVGDRIGYYLHVHLQGVPPNHYEYIPEILGRLFGMGL